MVLYPSFGWDEAAYHLEGDPEGRTFAEILVDVVATEVIEPWGGGKWHLEDLPLGRTPSPRTGTGRCDSGLLTAMRMGDVHPHAVNGLSDVPPTPGYTWP